MTRWTLSIPDKTDRGVRIYLGRWGGKDTDLSRFVDEAARRRLLDLSVDHVKARNAQSDQAEILDLIDAELDAVRADRS